MVLALLNIIIDCLRAIFSEKFYGGEVAGHDALTRYVTSQCLLRNVQGMQSGVHLYEIRTAMAA